MVKNRYISDGKPMYGGFGKATICKDAHLDRKVVVKEIIHEEEKERLLNEIKALQKAKSKNVVQIYDVIYDGSGNACIVEEYLPGEDLTDHKFTTSGNFLRDLYQVASGLCDLHDCGIVHRDMKPNNVKYDAEAFLKIFDFGLAKHGKFPTSTVNNPGTVGFMAPELFENPPRIDKPIDVYAFGVTAFYMASGNIPSSSLTLPPSALAGSIGDYVDLPTDISNLIDGCLELDPKKRPSMGHVKSLLQRQLLYNRHKAAFVVNGTIHELNSEKNGVKIYRGTTDSSVVRYDGYDFWISDVVGSVYINSTKVNSTQWLPVRFLLYVSCALTV